MIGTALGVEQYDCPFIATTDDHGVEFSAIRWDFDRVNDHLETRMVVEAADRETLSAGLSTLRDHENVHDYGLLTRRDNVAHIRTVIGETAAMATIRDNGGYITGPFHIEGGSETWHGGFDGVEAADTTLSGLDRDDEFDVLDRQNTELPEMQDFVQNAGAAMTLIEGCRDLSEVERRTLETAVSKNLHRGQQKMIQRVIEALDELE